MVIIKTNVALKASVIIPVYNQVELLNITLRYFGLQSCPPDYFEVIVVDDGSTDGLDSLMERGALPELSCTFRYFRQNNQGRAAARNTGVSLAQGEVLIFCDADRLPSPEFVAKHLEKCRGVEGYGVIGCPQDYFGQRNLVENFSTEVWTKIRKFSRTPQYYAKIAHLFNQDGFSNSAIAWAAFLVGNASIRKNDFMKTAGFDPDFITWGFEHFELAFRLQRQGVLFRSCPEIVNYHLPHPRERGYYQTMITQSTELLKEKHPDYPFDLLKSFLFGTISLQDFEAKFGGSGVKPQIRIADPLYMNSIT